MLSEAFCLQGLAIGVRGSREVLKASVSESIPSIPPESKTTPTEIYYCALYTMPRDKGDKYGVFNPGKTCESCILHACSERILMFPIDHTMEAPSLPCARVATVS